MKEYKVGDVATYMNRLSDWISRPIVHEVIKRIDIYGDL